MTRKIPLLQTFGFWWMTVPPGSALAYLLRMAADHRPEGVTTGFTLLIVAAVIFIPTGLAIISQERNPGKSGPVIRDRYGMILPYPPRTRSEEIQIREALLEEEARRRLSR